ncbi:uncharacterized protein [Coffea arabica]|uniref:SWIM-type domain-containing protein n=1 Tax=Coffea arabica TaxID=13443 RepID=A0ABM4UQM0_COFAR
MDDPKLELGLLFKCKIDFINAAKSHGVKYERKIRFKKNDSNRCKAICRGKRCMWNTYCSIRSDKVTFQSKSMLLTHICGRTTYHGLTSVTYLANKYLEDIRLNPNFNVGDFMTKVHKDLGVSITPNVRYKVRAKAKEMIHGDVMFQYSKLWSYCEELQKANPDSNVFMTTTENNEGDDKFQRFYVCLDGCKRGFLQGCRYVVGLDGCHLRGCHKGVLLTVVEELNGDLEIIDQSIWTFITDKQKGLVQAIQEVLPGVEHRMCVRHMQKPILDILETIRFYLMVRIEKKREWIKKYTGEICPKILKKLEKNKLAANDCIPSHSRDWKFEVRCMYGDRYTVDLISRCCSCRKWDLNGIPCAHAIAVICDTGEEPEKFVNNCYSKEAYMRAYEPMISPMNAEHMWKNSDMPPVLLPENIKLPGRPRKAKRRELDEPTSGKKQNKQQQKLPTPPVPKSNTQMSKELMVDARLGSQQSISNYSIAATIPVENIGKYKCSICHQYGHIKGRFSKPGSIDQGDGQDVTILLTGPVAEMIDNHVAL